MVELQGSYTFDAPQEMVWEALQDPAVLSQVLPGCERLEQVGENEYEGELNIRIGPVHGTFQGKVTLSNILAPDSYHLDIEGQGRPGYIKGVGDIKLESEGGQTTLNYVGEASLSGRIASVGQRLVDSTARSLTRQGLESLDRQIQARLHPVPEPEEGQEPAPAPPSSAQVATNVARDVARGLVAAQPFSGRNLAIVAAGLVAIFWMWHMLFGED